MKEQKKLTMELVKSLMDESYTLVWTDYNDNLDNRLDLIHECLASKSQENCGKRQMNGTEIANGKQFMKSSQD